MSADADAALTRFALLEGFFRRREEAGKFYCADCLVLQLRQRGSPAFCLGSILAAADDAFERPGALHLKPSGLKTVSQPPATSRDVQPHVVGRRGDRRIVMWIESGPFSARGRQASPYEVRGPTCERVPTSWPTPGAMQSKRAETARGCREGGSTTGRPRIRLRSVLPLVHRLRGRVHAFLQRLVHLAE